MTDLCQQELSDVAYAAKSKLRLTQQRCAQKTPHVVFFRLGFKKSEGFFIASKYAFLLDLSHFFGMCFPEMIEPAQTIIKTDHIIVFSCCSNGFLHGADSFGVTAKVCMQNSKIKERILVKGTISIEHSIIKIAMEVVE